MMLKKRKFEKVIVLVCVIFFTVGLNECKGEDSNSKSSNLEKQENREEGKFRIYYEALTEILNLKSVDQDLVEDVFHTKEINGLISKLSQVINDYSITQYECFLRVGLILQDLHESVPVFRLREFPTKQLWNKRKDLNSRIRDFYILEYSLNTRKFEKVKYKGKNPSIEEISRKYNELANKVIDDPNYYPVMFQMDFETWLWSKNEPLAYRFVYTTDPAWIPEDILSVLREMRGEVDPERARKTLEVGQNFIEKILTMQKNSNQEIPTLVVSQRLIAEIDFSTVVPESLIVSPDSKRVAYVLRVDSSQLVIVDGKEGKKYDTVTALTFSPNSRRVAYVAESGGEQFAVVDGKEEKKYEAVRTLTFSPDSERVAYVAESGGDQFVFVDGNEGEKYDAIKELTFSPDSERIAYLAHAETFGNKCVVVLDGKESKKYDAIAHQAPSLRSKPDLRFSPDGSQLAYGAQVGNKMFVVLDSGEHGKYDAVSPPVFSRDGKRLAYVATVGDRWFVVADGKAGKQYDALGEDDPLFSPDSKRLAYTARIGNSRFVVLDGKEEKKYDSIGPGSLLFSPESNRLAYVAQEGNKQFVVVDGKEEKRYYGIAQGSLVFSPDSRGFAYGAMLGDKNTVVLNGKEGKHYEHVRVPFVFSPDSRHLVYVAGMGKKQLVVVDGKEGTEYEVILTESGIIFDSPDAFHFLVLKDSGIYLVVCNI